MYHIRPVFCGGLFAVRILSEGKLFRQRKAEAVRHAGVFGKDGVEWAFYVRV